MNYLVNIEAIEEAGWKSHSVLYKPVGISLSLERVIGSAVNKAAKQVSTSLQRTYPQQKNQHSYSLESFSKCRPISATTLLTLTNRDIMRLKVVISGLYAW